MVRTPSKPSFDHKQKTPSQQGRSEAKHHPMCLYTMGELYSNLSFQYSSTALQVLQSRSALCTSSASTMILREMAILGLRYVSAQVVRACPPLVSHLQGVPHPYPPRGALQHQQQCCCCLPQLWPHMASHGCRKLQMRRWKLLELQHQMSCWMILLMRPWGPR